MTNHDLACLAVNNTTDVCVYSKYFRERYEERGEDGMKKEEKETERHQEAIVANKNIIAVFFIGILQSFHINIFL